MKNFELAKMFYEIADFLEMQDVEFKPQAYRKVARFLESSSQDIGKIYHEGGVKALDKIPGVGSSIAQKIGEYLDTGKMKYYEEQKKKIPVNILELTAIEGVGPKMVKEFYKKLGIKTIAQLEKAAKQHKISNLQGFKEKTEQNILKGIEFLKRSKGRHLLGVVIPLMKEVISKLKKLKEVEQINAAGSVRRMQETIGDLDILVTTSKPKKVIDYFVSLPEVIDVYGKGPTRASVRFEYDMDGDIRVVPEECYGSALQYFTGDKAHNIKLRKIAIEQGYKLNEYGLFKGRKRVAGRTEEEIYLALGMKLMEPEIRTDSGEIEASINNKLPKLVKYEEIKGDFHVHSNWSDGLNTIEEMALKAKKLGHQYMAITDHTGTLKIARGLTEKDLLKQIKEIEKINKRISGFRILTGAEINILSDGGLDMNERMLKKLDFVIAAVHSHFKMTEEQMTNRIIKAMKNPYVCSIAHPTGRIIFQRPPYQINLPKIFKAANQTKTALEINAYMDRLDLRDVDIRAALAFGVKFSIGTDSHNTEQLRMIELGTAQARRGWAGSKDILNTYNVAELMRIIHRKRIV